MNISLYPQIGPSMQAGRARKLPHDRVSPNRGVVRARHRDRCDHDRDRGRGSGTQDHGGGRQDRTQAPAASLTGVRAAGRAARAFYWKAFEDNLTGLSAMVAYNLLLS